MTPSIAFYAPLKPPDHPVPSGDRRFARLLRRALSMAGYKTSLASRFRSRNRDGNALVQSQLEKRAERLVESYLRRHTDEPPALWFTYHLYHKAPDLLGPSISKALDIPYVIAEASVAPKRRDGHWARGYALALDALSQASLVFQPNPLDRICLEQEASPNTLQIDLPPFLDTKRDLKGYEGRSVLAQRFALNPNKDWVLATGMMRPGAKQASYDLLASAIERLPHEFELLLVGDGSARSAIQERFAQEKRAHFLGAQDAVMVQSLNANADIFAWPAIDEAFGLACLEAMAAGCASVLGDRPGIRAMAVPEKTALLVREGDVSGFTKAMASLLADKSARQVLGQSAREHVARNHDIANAASIMKRHLDPVLARGRG